MISGSSLDGLDLAAVRFRYLTEQRQWGFSIAASQTLPYSEEWVTRLQALPTADAYTFAKTHTDYAHLCGMLARQFLLEHELSPDLIASHGHTVFHAPEKHFTAQIGDGETLSTYFSAPLVCNFRNKDVALGGEGAPLVPFGEHALFPQYSLFLNLGGIANLSYLPKTEAQKQALLGRTWAKRPPEHLAFDLCGCNQVLNALARQAGAEEGYDNKGSLARNGKPLPTLLEQLGQWSYLHVPPPKSLGNADVRTHQLEPLLEYPAPPADKLHTYVQFLAQQTAQALEQLGLADQALLVTGGGAWNEFLFESLKAALQPLGIAPRQPQADVVNFKEALIFALLGLQTVQGKPNILHGTTGARAVAVAGSLHFPAAKRASVSPYWPQGCA